TEVPSAMVRRSREWSALFSSYAWINRRTISPEHDVPWGYVISRWPATPIESLAGASVPTEVFAVRVETPSGPVAVLSVHAASPRNAERWARGNEAIDRAAQVARVLQDAGFPVILVGDLNGTPTGTRS